MSHQIASHWTEVLKGQILTFGISAAHVGRVDTPLSPQIRPGNLPVGTREIPEVAALEALLESLLQAFALKLPIALHDRAEVVVDFATRGPLSLEQGLEARKSWKVALQC